MDMKVLEEELKKGWEATSQLRSLLLFPPELECGNASSNRDYQNQSSQNDKILPFLESHYATIINSFDSSISILKQLSQSSKPSICQKSKVGQKSRSRMIETSNLEPDGYAWRKYGEKSILNTKHPREYYRCGYRDDQNCQATKHVQKISGSPTKYRIIYYAHHTCNPLLHSNFVSQIHVSDSSEKDFSNLISFESKNPTQIPKQNINEPFCALIFPSSSNKSSKELSPQNGEFPSLSKTTNNPPPSLVDSMKNPNPQVVSNAIIGDVNQQQGVVLSPSMLMSPNYMATSYVDIDGCDLAAGYEQLYDMDGALQLQDIPFAEMNVSPMWE
ncbi:probable WRKY transcription factor 30 [Chenopodium quinoa]|uniref:probable WRKY transcription factor 30 n=1 Tax=Chenopodium quinoa TaxID=63459 RepID=UPI000B76BCF3|nr:probable WRKY transcription factor 30 [Chenopodium quinoa]